MLEHNLRFRGTYYIFFFIINTHLDKTKKKLPTEFPHLYSTLFLIQKYPCTPSITTL